MSDPKRTELASYPGSAIAVLDVLGMKVSSKEMATEFINIRDQVIASAESLHVRAQEQVVPNGTPGFDYGIFATSSFTFGDTMILYWPGLRRMAPPRRFIVPGFVLQVVMAQFLANGMLLRGALSFGEYYTDGRTTALGPALNSAADWYDKAEIAGVVLTPQASLDIHLACEMKPEHRELSFLRSSYYLYDVPIKGAGKRRLWTVKWPRVFSKPEVTVQLGERGFQTTRQALIDRLAQRDIPYGAENKVLNTLEYFDSCINEEGMELDQ